MGRGTRRGESAARGGQAGFTLLELLISLVILTLILSFIPGTLRMGQRVWETEDRYAQRAALDSFRRYVEQRMTEAIPINVRDLRLGLHIEFTGEPGRVIFIAPAPAGPGGGGVYRFELRRAEGPEDYQPLLLRQSIYRIPDLGAPPIDDRALPPSAAMEHRSRSGVTGLSLRYFGSPERGKPPQWQALWPRRDAVPDLVEITIFIGGRNQQVERSVVALQLKPQ
jgi:general secretion pathway protein J